MSFLDLLAMLPFYWPLSASRERSPAENVIAALALVVFPALDFVVVLWGKLYEHTVIAIALPAAFAVAVAMLGRRLRASGGFTVGVSLGCGALCLLASGTATLIGIFVSSYSSL